jgi:excisionase family DNA binding protein
MVPTPAQLLTVNEVAKRLWLGRRAVEYLISRQTLCSVQIGRRRLVDKHSLLTVIQSIGSNT